MCEPHQQSSDRSRKAGERGAGAGLHSSQAPRGVDGGIQSVSFAHHGDASVTPCSDAQRGAALGASIKTSSQGNYLWVHLWEKEDLAKRDGIQVSSVCTKPWCAVQLGSYGSSDSQSVIVSPIARHRNGEPGPMQRGEEGTIQA